MPSGGEQIRAAWLPDINESPPERPAESKESVGKKPYMASREGLSLCDGCLCRFLGLFLNFATEPQYFG